MTKVIATIKSTLGGGRFHWRSSFPANLPNCQLKIDKIKTKKSVKYVTFHSTKDGKITIKKQKINK